MSYNCYKLRASSIFQKLWLSSIYQKSWGRLQFKRNLNRLPTYLDSNVIWRVKLISRYLTIILDGRTGQSWKKLHAMCADIFSGLRTFWLRNHAHMLWLQICVEILIYLGVNIEEWGLKSLFEGRIEAQKLYLRLKMVKWFWLLDNNQCF
jgi:hypothetical protein